MEHKLVWNDGDINGTSFLGYLGSFDLDITAAKIVTLGGQDLGAGDKTSVEFFGTFDGATFTLYDYKGDGTFHIGGGNLFRPGGKALNIAAFITHLTALLATVEPDPNYRRDPVLYDEGDYDNYAD